MMVDFSRTVFRESAGKIQDLLEKLEEPDSVDEVTVPGCPGPIRFSKEVRHEMRKFRS